MTDTKTRIGVVGRLYARGLVMTLDGRPDVTVSKVLRAQIGKRQSFPGKERLTRSVEDLIEHSDIVIECSGDVVYATNVLIRCCARPSRYHHGCRSSGYDRPLSCYTWLSLKQEINRAALRP